MPTKTYASFYKRLLAFSVDWFLVLALYNLFYLLYLGRLALNMVGELTPTEVVIEVARVSNKYNHWYFWLGVFLYFSLSLFLFKGRTLGRVLACCKVIKTNGKNIDFISAFIRTLLSPISYLVFGIGVLWMLFDGKSQTWHDKIARTSVVNSKNRILNITFGVIISLFFWLFFLYFYSLSFLNAVVVGFDYIQQNPPIKTQYTQVNATVEKSNILFTKLKRETNKNEAKNLSKENLDLIQSTINEYPTSAILYKYLGDAITWDNSITAQNNDVTFAYQKAVDLEPNNYIYLIDLANAYTVRGQFDKGITYYNKSLQIKADNNVIAHFGLGKAYSGLGNQEKATYHMNIALELFESENFDGKWDSAIEEAVSIRDGEYRYGKR